MSALMAAHWLPVWLSGNTLFSINVFTPGPVSAWMGDHLWMDKPLRCRTRHSGLLSLTQPSVGRQN